MSFRPSHLAILAAALAPLAAGCGETSARSPPPSPRPATVAVVDTGPHGSDQADHRRPRPCPMRTRSRPTPPATTTKPRTSSPPTPAPAPTTPGATTCTACRRGRRGTPSRRIASFDEALRLDPQHRKSLLNSARVLLETGRPREALERVERAMAIEPLSGEGLRLLGRARYELKQIPEAIDAYQRAIALDERDGWAMNNLGLIYIQQDRSDAALPIAGARGGAALQLAGLPEQPRHRPGAHRATSPRPRRRTRPRWRRQHLRQVRGEPRPGDPARRERHHDGRSGGSGDGIPGGSAARGRESTAAAETTRPGRFNGGPEGFDREPEGYVEVVGREARPQYTLCGASARTCE